MSFLDNLESSLNSLERQEERNPNEMKQRQDERSRVLAAAPWAERLRNSGYTKELMDKAAVAGHRLRTKIYMAWIDSTLRLEARERVLELRPTADGIVAELSTGTGEPAVQPLNLESDPDELLNQWLDGMMRPRPAAETGEHE